MRINACLIATVLMACLNSTYVYSQGAGDAQTDPYRKHLDARHGHDRAYPDRGSIVRDLPRGAVVVNYAGVSYRFDAGVWYEPRGPAFVVIEPPIGLLVPALPGFTTPVVHAGETFMYANNVYYRARPELGGYEVVNEPADSVPATVSAGKSNEAPNGPAAPPPPTVPVSASAPASGAGPIATPLPAAPLPSPATVSASSPATVSASSPATVSASSPATVSASSPATVSASSPATVSASPASASPLPPASQMGPRVFIYPRAGQSADQQARDRYECYRFAMAQTGYDPMHSGGAQSSQSDYERAQAACLDGRGYSVK